MLNFALSRRSARGLTCEARHNHSLRTSSRRLVPLGLARILDIDQRRDRFDLTLGLDLALAQDFELSFELPQLPFDLAEAFLQLVNLTKATGAPLCA